MICRADATAVVRDLVCRRPRRGTSQSAVDPPDVLCPEVGRRASDCLGRVVRRRRDAEDPLGQARRADRRARARRRFTDPDRRRAVRGDRCARRRRRHRVGHTLDRRNQGSRRVAGVAPRADACPHARPRRHRRSDDHRRRIDARPARPRRRDAPVGQAPRADVAVDLGAVARRRLARADRGVVARSVRARRFVARARRAIAEKGQPRDRRAPARARHRDRGRSARAGPRTRVGRARRASSAMRIATPTIAT